MASAGRGISDQLLRELRSTEARHDDIGEQQFVAVEAFSLDDRPRFDAVARGSDLVSKVGEERDGELAHRRIVLDQQDAFPASGKHERAGSPGSSLTLLPREG